MLKKISKYKKQGFFLHKNIYKILQVYSLQQNQFYLKIIIKMIALDLIDLNKFV